jgi:hypothetical protein
MNVILTKERRVKNEKEEGIMRMACQGRQIQLFD